MFASRNFVACIEQQLVERGFGAKRKAEILDKFYGTTKFFRAQGYGDQVSQAMAMNKVFADLALETMERAKRAQKTLEVQAKVNTLIGDAVNTKVGGIALDGGKGPGAAAARAAIALIQQDPRFPIISAEEMRNAYRGKYWLLLSDGLDKFGKGAFGTQRGASGLYDIVREIFNPGSTKNKEAADFAKAYGELDKVMVSDRNNAGGSLSALDNYIPQKQNTAKLLKAGEEKWKADMRELLDWDRMTWPNGEPIKPEDRERVLSKSFETLSSGGTNKIDLSKSFGAQGAALGNALGERRFLLFKDGDAWIKMHEAYGDGNVFDVIRDYVEMMAHQTALINQFGPNPSLMYENIKLAVLKHANNAQKKGAKDAVSTASAILKNRLKPMFDMYTHANPLDTDSKWATLIVSTSNVLTAAKLGSVPFLAMPGDFAQTLAVRFANHMPLLQGIGTYMKGLTVDYASNQRMATRHGFIFDNVVGATYTTERFSPVNTYGAQITRTIADDMIRASGLNRHTEIARWANQHEFAGLLYDSFKTKFDDLPFKRVLERYGIDEAAWDAVRKNTAAFSPEPRVETFRPFNILDTSLANKHDLYTRFYTMIDSEAKYMVPGATLEANIMMTGGLRPDTLPGAILHSFKMYKNFPITFAQMYGRMAQAQDTTFTKLRFYGSIILGATIVGAMGVQLRELAKGRTPLPMDTATFWGKAFLAGGGASIYGDFLFSGVNEYGKGPGDVIAGPIAGLMKDTADLALGDTWRFVSLWDKDDTDKFKAAFPSRAVNFLRMNTPGTSLWYARLALDREIWDALDNLVDPAANRKRNLRMRRQERNYGNTYWSPPGAGLSGRGPMMTGR